MRFCDRQVVRRALNGKRVALVGSGPGVLENKPGFVDSHDVVVRANNYKTGPAQGFRCDVFYSFFGSSIKKTALQLKRDGVRLCICKCPNAKFLESEWHVKHGKANGVDFRYIYELRKTFWFCDTYVPDLSQFLHWFWLLDDHVPTTGFAALLEILLHEPASVYMTGFDFFASGVHNVNERWRPGDPSDPIGHSPKRERRWLQANMGKYPIQFDPSLKQILMEPAET
jgi:hypothetical protein